jgi:hypothetical protein
MLSSTACVLTCLWFSGLAPSANITPDLSLYYDERPPIVIFVPADVPATIHILGKSPADAEVCSGRELYLDSYRFGWTTYEVEPIAVDADGFTTDLRVPFLQGCGLQLRGAADGQTARERYEARFHRN